MQHAKARGWDQTEAWPSLKKMGSQVQEPKKPRDPEPGPDPPLVEGQPLDPAQDFRNYISELFMENTVTGLTTQKIFHKASGAGARGSEDLARCGASGKAKKCAQRSDEENYERMHLSR